MKRLVLSIFCGGLLSACGERHQDLQQFMSETEKSLPRKIEPLPPVKAYTPFEYAAFNVPDPFRPRKLTEGKGGGLQPDANRRKEPLESYPLESLKMVGTLEQNRRRFALIRAENVIYRVGRGNYLGQNYGQIVDISDSEVKLKEIVQDTAGDWTERATALQLLDEAEKK